MPTHATLQQQQQATKGDTSVHRYSYIEKSIKLATTLQKYSLFFEKVHIFENFYQKQAENHFHHTTLLLETKSSNRHNCPLYSRMYLHVVFVFVMQQVIVIVKCFNAKCKDLRPTSVHVI